MLLSTFVPMLSTDVLRAHAVHRPTEGLCRRANVEKIDAGPKGVVIAFRGNEFPNPAGLVSYIGEQGVLAKIRPDQKVVLSRDWATADQRLKGSAAVLLKLVRLAEADSKAA